VDPTTLTEDDFTGTNGSAWSADWTTGYTGLGSVTLQNGWGRIQVGSSGIVSRRLTTTPAENGGNITFKYRVNGWVYPELLMRHGSTVLDRQNDYGLRLPTPQDGNLKLYKHVNYSYGSSLASVPFSVIAGQVVRIRLFIDGGRFQIKCWADGATEPEAWMIDVTDTTYTAAGYWGFYAGSGGTSGHYLEVDDFHWDDGETGETTTTVTTTTSNSTATPVPAGPSPWRWDNPNTELVTAVDGSTTVLQARVTAGAMWTTATEDLPIDLWLDGETVTATDIDDIVNLAPNPILAANATDWAVDPGDGTGVVGSRQTSGGWYSTNFYRVSF
jgi:hypothetical protein